MAQAKVTPHHLISDNMVLQQDSDVRLYGYSEPGAKILVTPSWDNVGVKVKAGKDGRWEVFVHTPLASMTPYSITFDDGEPLTVNNVLCGEVWVAAGQSNMEMPVRGFDSCPVEGLQETIRDAVNSPGVRYAKIPSKESMEPQEDADTHWTQVTPQTVMWASATAYYFARLVSRTLGIPVGIIEANKGGTRVESWLNRANLEAYTDEILDPVKMNEKFPMDYYHPLTWGNGTFNPILKYTVKGILFYQGCSNVGDPGNRYSERLAMLVKQWRDAFGLGEIPFFFVEIAPFSGEAKDAERTWSALLREQQKRAESLIPNSTVICTNDAVYPYEITQIHPCQKSKVGERLGYSVLNKIYGHSEFAADSPAYRSMQVEGDKIWLEFDHMDGGINRWYDVQGFEIAGEDKVFHPATFSHYWGRYYVSSPEVPAPVAVRYCFKNFCIGNLGNALGLPLFPFRTDDWPE